MSIGSVVRRAREEAGLTQAELAARAGTSQPAVARLEAGQGSPSFATAERLVSAAGYDLSLSLVPKRVVRDAVVDAYKVDVDRTMLRENLKRTPEERIQAMLEMDQFDEALRRAVKEAKRPRRGKK